MQKIITVVLFSIMSLYTYAQQGTIKGVVIDGTTDIPLIGAHVLIGEGSGGVTDIDGNFVIKADAGSYTVKASYVGYGAQEKTVEVKAGKTVEVNFKLGTVELNEVKVVADVAIKRETPVAFTNISPKKLQEELSGQDLPMVLNSTPGVYATQQGGGDGDARINIRGFNQRNIAVMIDGIPVNDMENGWVYWSNWFGLDVVTRTMQVQRGLGASKLAIPSVGGTMNIITQGLSSKKGGKIKQTIGNDGYLNTTLGYSTGRLKNGFGITAAGSYKSGNGWADNTFTKGFFYYIKIDKEIKKHILSVSVMGAPQEHGQRSYKQPIGEFNHEYALEAGIPDSLLQNIPERGLRYNPHWGELERLDVNANGDTIHADKETLTEKLNYYHKPLFTIKDSWSINDKLYLATLAYASIGNGGGTGNTGGTSTGAPGSSSAFSYTTNGQIDYQAVYNLNKFGSKYQNNINEDFMPAPNRYAYGILSSSINSHRWYGFLSTLNYDYNDNLTFSGGLDLRTYKGIHYKEVYDLLGADYFLDNSNKNVSTADYVCKKGDKILYHNESFVRWSGLFAMAEYKKGLWSGFLNISSAVTGYKRIDYFRKKTLQIGDTTLEIGYADTVNYNGQQYTRDAGGLDYAQTEWKYMPGFTVKGGVNYNLSRYENVFINMGLLSRNPMFDFVINRSNEFNKDVKNEFVKAIEGGYTMERHKIAINLNGYFTIWENKPFNTTVTDPDDSDIKYTVNINGMVARHMGAELDFAYKILPNLELDGMVSYGDWIWNAERDVDVYSEQGTYIMTKSFKALGVHVGDAAQTQFAASLRYEPIKKLYVTARVTYFDRYYADFDPFDYDVNNSYAFYDDGSPIDAWKVPAYYLVDAHAGYSFKLKKFEKIYFRVKFSMLNVLDEVYISDAKNNDTYSSNFKDFDAKSAGVFFGMGRRYTTALQISF